MSAVLDNVYEDPYNGVVDYDYLLYLQEVAESETLEQQWLDEYNECVDRR